MSKEKKYQAPVSPKQIDASAKLVEKAASTFTYVTRMTALEKQRAAKARRWAHQVIPTLAQIARKFAIEAPGNPIDDMLSRVEHAQSLESLLGAVAQFHATLKDEYFGVQTEAWKSATVTYGMLRKAAEGDKRVSDEIEPVQKWFRQGARAKKSATQPSVTAPTTPAHADAAAAAAKA